MDWRKRTTRSRSMFSEHHFLNNWNKWLARFTRAAVGYLATASAETNIRCVQSYGNRSFITCLFYNIVFRARTVVLGLKNLLAAVQVNSAQSKTWATLLDGWTTNNQFIMPHWVRNLGHGGEMQYAFIHWFIHSFFQISTCLPSSHSKKPGIIKRLTCHQ